jgi:hypothetical protein
MTEELDYSVIRAFCGFEVRRYPDYAVVECVEIGDFAAAGNRAFGPLFQFISGANSAGQSIPMTAPVLQQTPVAGEHRVAFVMPSSIDASAVPQPRSGRLRTQSVAGRDMAVRRFSGNWSERRMAEQADALRNAVQAAGLHCTDEVTYARFDPPWKPGIFRRNEVMVPLREPLSG